MGFSWATLFCILLMSIYSIVSKRVEKVPKIPFTLFITFFVLQFAIQMLEGYEWSKAWIRYVAITSDIILSWAVARFVFWFILEFLAKIKQDEDILPKITRDLILFLTFIILFFVVLRVRSDINLASLLTTSALLTVVIGLAAQATLSNLFSGLIIQAERPFAIGDWIRFEEYEGTVIGISWKSTQILTREKILVYIPNSVLASSTFSNFSRPNRKKVAIQTIGLDYSVPPNKVINVINQVLDQNSKVLKQPKAVIRVAEFSDFSVQYEIRYWHNNYAFEPQLKGEINNQLWYALRRNHIRIPFPVRDVQHAHIERKYQKENENKVVGEIQAMFEGVPILSPLSDSERADLARKVHIETYGTGELVVQEGEEGDSMYIVLSGSCEAIRSGSRHQAKVLSKFNKGDFFGEISLLTGEKRTASIQATEDIFLIVVNKNAFATVINSNAMISEQIGKVVVQRKMEDETNFEASIDMSTDSQKLIRKIKLFFGV
ncbi:MAG: mechanosensitive ion channel family protein [Pseudomonadota bacterium]